MKKYGYSMKNFPRNGWKPIFAYAVKQLMKLELPDIFRITDVKEEKGLCVVEYENAGDKEKEVIKILENLKDKSATICEICGKEGRLCELNDLQNTLCHSCFNKSYGEIHSSEDPDAIALKMRYWGSSL